MRAVKVAIAAIAVFVVGAALATAQGTVPTITVTATPGSVTATPVPVAPGATRFEFVSTAEDAEQGVFLASPKRGFTDQDVIAAVRANPEASFEVADIVASVALTPGGRRAVTATIEPGRTYILVNDGGGENPANWTFAALATGGNPTGATAPRPNAEVRMRDLRFLGASTLPRRGTIRVRNVGWAPHFAIAARLRDNARQAPVARAIERNQDRRLGQLLDFESTIELTNILTRGATADQEVRFPKRGRYVLVCFFENHNKQGMYRFVRVR